MNRDRKRPIILDTDPGGDDLFALFWLLSLVRQDVADLVAITTAAGNVSAQRTFTNASQVLRLFRQETIAIGRGTDSETTSENASHIHGNDGMGNLSTHLPSASHDFASAPQSADLIVEHLSAHPGEMTLVAVAPLTNLAAAETQCPGILQKAREIVIMGGAIRCPGNVTPQAEFNIWFDPTAATTVFQSRANITLLTLDVTHQLRLTPAMVQSVVAGHPFEPRSQFLTQLCEFMVSTALGYRETGGLPAFLVHDAAAIGQVFYPELFSFKRVAVQIETQGQWTKGQTIVGDRRFATPHLNAWVALEVDEGQFFTNLLADLRSLMA
jgi:inosine-uridine nucleoside N-ribohydrolase